MTASPDTGLARERTLLARRRTALSVGLVYVALLRVLLGRAGNWPAVGAGLVALPLLYAAVSAGPRLRTGLGTLILALAVGLLALTAGVLLAL
ncbi:MAG TPA: hypothetical protein VHF26_15780 [Trebonia sp.]|uniref:hypothetical protein n=1 Tax=Nocardioides sp. TaxID=35761 RepID=UPI002C597100|nr:hypothetical protein [Nocardioides sp.]HVT69210.1 hypothetical protein [Trebonia sp.]HVX54636.1 hypothetical protein [Nocardioides sp.]